MDVYEPTEPTQTVAFQNALRAGRPDLLQLHLGAEALQELSYAAFRKVSHANFTLDTRELEIALGCGSDGAEICGEMAGYSKSRDAIWYLGDAEKCQYLKVPSSLLKAYALQIAHSI